MTKNRKITISVLSTAIPVLSACAFLLCNSPAREDTLKWRSSIEIPLNLSLKVGGGGLGAPTAGDTVSWDLGVHEVSLRSDVTKLLSKLTDHKADWQISVTNNTGAELKLYGLLFGENDEMATKSVDEFYDFLTETSGSGTPAHPWRVNLSGSSGMTLQPWGTAKRESMPTGASGSSGASDPFTNLIIYSDAVAYRWLVRVGSSGIPNLGSEKDSVDIRMRIKVSGVNSFDSLFTM